MNDDTPLASSLHAVYVNQTGLSLPLSMQRIFAWSAWSKDGYTKDDLTLVISWLKNQIRQQRKWPSSMIFSRLIDDRETFAEHLSMARADARRTKADPGLKRVLVQTGRRCKEEPVKVTVRTAAQIIAAEKAFAEFRQLKQTL